MEPPPLVAAPAAPAPASEPFAPPCPKCKTPLAGIGETDTGEGICGGCAVILEYTLYPARNRPKPVARAVRSMEGDATCYFHPQNHAVAVCDDCGRYVCTVCELPAEDGGRRCPPCVSAGRKKTKLKADEVVVYDSLALGLAVLPVLVWPATLLTAPAALCVALYGWKKPRSLVRPGSWKFVTALIVSVLEIGAWVALGLSIWVNA